MLSSGCPFAFGCGFSLLVILPLVSRLLRKGDGSYLYSRSPQVVFLPWVETFSLFVSLPLFISLVCCAEKAWQRSLVSGVSLPPQRNDEQWFFFRICSRRFLALDCLCFILLRGKLMAPTEVVFWRLVTEVFLELLMGWSHDVCFHSRLPMTLGLLQQTDFPLK
jgi:hypothetical protein